MIFCLWTCVAGPTTICLIMIKLNKIIFRQLYSYFSQLHKDFFSNSRFFFKFLYNRPKNIYTET